MEQSEKMKFLFETEKIPRALRIMAIPTIISQLITLIYNIADTWFIGRTNNPYMVGASSLSATVFLMIICIANFFGAGGGNQVVSLLGKGEEEEAKRVGMWSLALAGVTALVISIGCFLFQDPLLYLLGASSNTLVYAKQYLMYVVILGCVPTVLSNTMSFLLRNVGYAREATVGLSLGGILNVVLDPLFMFVLLPQGQEVSGAAIATLLSNCFALLYYIVIYIRASKDTVLRLPKKWVNITRSSLWQVVSVGCPAALSLMFYNLTNIVINKLCAAHGDIELAAIGIILKVERLPLNIGIGICLGMMPLIAYNFSAGNRVRAQKFYQFARTAGFIISAVCLIFYFGLAREIMQLFIAEKYTVLLGTTYLKARSFAPAFMFLSFHMVYYMQAVGRGGISFWLAVIRQIVLNIPILFLLDYLFGMSGIIWTQVTADFINVIISYVIYWMVIIRKDKVSWRLS